VKYLIVRCHANAWQLRQTLTDPDKFYRLMLADIKSRVKTLAPWAKGAQNGSERWEFFCNGYNELAFQFNGTDRHEIREKTSVTVLYWTLIEQFWKFALKRWFCTKRPFLGCFDGSSCHRPTGQALRFSTYRSLPSIRGRANGVPTLNRLFVRLTVSAVEAPKLIQISLSELQRSLSGDTATDHAICFSFELCSPRYSGRSDGVYCLRRFFCMNCRFVVTRLLNNLPCFRNFDDVTNTVTRCFSLFSIKR